MSENEQLDDVASIRKRPGMYVGEVANRSGTHQMVWEVLANAIDEFLAGRCTRIDVTLHSDGSLSVADDGAGISLEVDGSGTSWLERVLTTLHDTATADGHAPTFISGASTSGYAWCLPSCPRSRPRSGARVRHGASSFSAVE